MFDTTSQTVMQRAEGEAAVAFAGGRLCGLRQRGCGKALLPRVRDAVPEAVFLNTAGGLTSGDRLSYRTEIAGGRLIATTQAAERAYRADHGPARVVVRHEVGPGGWLDWLPQETILFDRADLARETVISLAPEAGCLMLESVVLGRAAMGETVRDLRFHDTRRIERAGRPVFLEPFRLGTALLTGPRTAILGPARAFATLVLCVRGAEDALAPARAALTVEGVEAAASAFDGKCVVRLLAPDGWPLRKQILKLMAVLRQGAAPPRVWQI
ncbi:urease accessory protein UreD [Sinirhodobacter populi]|uniref:Urease accessory protein UreD n=1 Tax=Paenirhodobacter populi TaxID=2306993 RepID=A0A443KQ57_9RHOB|nr:urease accessory protein UreD [Sinirhodobacter populi]